MTGRAGLESLDFILRAEATHLTDKKRRGACSQNYLGKPQFHSEETGWDGTQHGRGTWKAGREHGTYVTFNSLMSSSPRSSRSSLVMQ